MESALSYHTKIFELRSGFSKSFSLLADFILDSYPEVAFMTASELAQRVGVDAATVVRFSQHLGYKGYPQLLREIQKRVKDDLLIQSRENVGTGSASEIVTKALADLKIGLEQTQMVLDPKSVMDLVDKIGDARRIIIVAEGPTQPSAYNLVNFLEQGRFPVHKSSPGLAGLARTIHTATEHDLLIAFDMAGEAPYIAAALREARGKGIPAAAIVGSPSLATARSANYVIAARANPDPGITMICIEAIIYVLLKTVRQEYSDRYMGVEKQIAELSSLLQ